MEYSEEYSNSFVNVEYLGLFLFFLFAWVFHKMFNRKDLHIWFYVVCQEIFKAFEESCKESIHKRDEELDKKALDIKMGIFDE